MRCPTSSNRVSEINEVSSPKQNRLFKAISVNYFKTHALIDTGSQVNLVKQNFYESINIPKLEDKNILLSGFGKSQVTTKGCFTCPVDINN